MEAERSRTDITGPTVMTVLGPVSAYSLGRVLVHEHLKIVMPGAELDLRGRQSRREVVRRAVDRLAELKEHGVGTFVDPCPIELGRDVELMAEVSERSGVNVVCSTGFYFETEGIGIPYYWRMRWPEEIAEFYVSEIESGVGTTGIRPGVIKAATGDEVGRHEAKALAAAGQAAASTGVAIITHTNKSRWGTDQQRIFAANGGDLSRCLIGHQDEAPSPEVLIDIAGSGSFVGIDRVGYETMASDDHRVELVSGLLKAGYGRQICLAQDHICVGHTTKSSMWIPKNRAEEIRRDLVPRLDAQGHARSSARIFTSFVPRLLDVGFSQQDIDTIFVDNPRRLLCGI